MRAIVISAILVLSVSTTGAAQATAAPPNIEGAGRIAFQLTAPSLEVAAAGNSHTSSAGLQLEPPQADAPAARDPERVPLYRPLSRRTSSGPSPHVARWLLIVGHSTLIAGTLLSLGTAALAQGSNCTESALTSLPAARAVSYSAVGVGLALIVGGVIRFLRRRPLRLRRVGTAIFGALVFGAATAMALFPSQAEPIFGCINS